jgi:hypothetical protein
MANSKKKTTTNKRADATKNYLSSQYGLDADTDTERVLGLVSDNIDPFEFVGREVDENPDVEWYCGNADDRMNVERARRQGWKVLDGDHGVSIRAGRQENHVYMYRPKSVGDRVRSAENAARRADQGMKHETKLKQEKVRVNVSDPYGME